MTLSSAAFIESLDSDSTNGLTRFVDKALSALERTYAVGLGLYLSTEAVGLRRRFVAPVATISIGNLSVGGTGKTPAVIAVARILQNLGFSLAILSRGHGGSKSRDGGVVSDNAGKILMEASEAGDEPRMLAECLRGVPVLVGKDRRRTATAAVERFNPDVLLLDDGFQYWQLARDLDIVLLDARRPFHNGHCLPRGLLREPATNLRRAEMVVFTRSTDLSLAERQSLIEKIGSIAPKAKVFFAEHAPGRIIAKNEAAQSLGHPESAYAVCAIARPESFKLSMKDAGIAPRNILCLADHHMYTKQDGERILAEMRNCGAISVITTEKDSVKLTGIMSDVPLFALEVNLRLREPASFTTSLLTAARLVSTGSKAKASSLC